MSENTGNVFSFCGHIVHSFGRLLVHSPRLHCDNLKYQNINEVLHALTGLTFKN